jgi:hypothetical protein
VKEPLKVINSSRSERGWRGRRRIAVLVSLAGVLGLCALGSAGTASAATVANCNAKLQPKGASTNAKLSFVCDAPVRAYGVGSNKPIKDYSNPTGGAASQWFTCEGGGAGFGCGITNRAAPGTQVPGTTGWNTTTPGASTSATGTPSTCNGFKRTQGAGTGVNGPNLNSIVTGACTEQIAPGTTVVQNIKLGSSPCAGGKKNPFQMFLFVGGEPGVTSFIDPVTTDPDPTKDGPGGDSTTVGEYLQGPTKVSLKAYKKACAKSGSSGKSGKGGGKRSSSPPSVFPVSCSGSVAPSSTPAGTDAKLTFSCTQNIRAFAIYSNKQISEPGDEPIVTGNNGGGVNESANAQCEGNIPGPGFGCGTVDRQTVTAAKTTPPTNPGLPNGNTITAGNTAEQNIAFLFSPCQRPGEPKTKVWIVPMGEPIVGSTVGEFVGAPQQLALTGYGKCKGGKKKK